MQLYTGGAGLTAQAWNPLLIAEQPCMAQHKLSMLPAKTLQPCPSWKKDRVGCSAEGRGQLCSLERAVGLAASREQTRTCCPLVFAPHHLGEAELIHANLRRINLMQLVQFYSAQSAAQLRCEVICYLYTISLEILNSDQMVPCTHKPGFHHLILF